MTKRHWAVGLLLSTVLASSAVAQRPGGPGGGGGMGPRQGGMQGAGTGQGRQSGGGHERGPRGDDPQKHLDRMAKDLNLTEAQKQQVETILSDHGRQLNGLRDDTSLTPERKREKMQAIR